MKLLLKLAKKSPDYASFERKCLKFSRFYEIPVLWTKKNLKEFYNANGGK